MSDGAAVMCWRCGTPLVPAAGEPFVLDCHACGALQPPASVTAFQLLGLPVGYEISLDDLDRRHHELSRRVHPDRFAAADSREKRFSLEWSTRLNDAYATLRDPLRRAEYLLAMHGVESQDESRTIMNPAFLDEQMDFRERLAELRHEPDPLPGLARLRRDLKSAVEERNEGLRVALHGPGLANPASAAILVQELKFFNKLLQEADRLEEQFD